MIGNGYFRGGRMLSRKNAQHSFDIPRGSDSALGRNCFTRLVTFSRSTISTISTSVNTNVGESAYSLAGDGETWPDTVLYPPLRIPVITLPKETLAVSYLWDALFFRSCETCASVSQGGKQHTAPLSYKLVTKMKEDFGRINESIVERDEKVDGSLEDGEPCYSVMQSLHPNGRIHRGRFTISGQVLALQPDIFAFTLLIQQNADGMSPHGKLRLRALMSMDGSAASPHALDSVNRGLLYGVVVVWVDTFTILQSQNDSPRVFILQNAGATVRANAGIIHNSSWWASERCETVIERSVQ
ncbi:hypothetical protein V8E53_014401 [Lactarius tabidus]